MTHIVSLVGLFALYMKGSISGSLLTSHIIFEF
jgi:uncharacterized membrane protein